MVVPTSVLPQDAVRWRQPFTELSQVGLVANIEVGNDRRNGVPKMVEYEQSIIVGHGPSLARNGQLVNETANSESGSCRAMRTIRLRGVSQTRLVCTPKSAASSCPPQAVVSRLQECPFSDTLRLGTRAAHALAA